jgi:hypothetical protein
MGRFFALAISLTADAFSSYIIQFSLMIYSQLACHRESKLNGSDFFLLNCNTLFPTPWAIHHLNSSQMWHNLSTLKTFHPFYFFHNLCLALLPARRHPNRWTRRGLPPTSIAQRGGVRGSVTEVMLVAANDNVIGTDDYKHNRFKN